MYRLFILWAICLQKMLAERLVAVSIMLSAPFAAINIIFREGLFPMTKLSSLMKEILSLPGDRMTRIAIDDILL